MCFHLSYLTKVIEFLFPLLVIIALFVGVSIYLIVYVARDAPLYDQEVAFWVLLMIFVNPIIIFIIYIIARGSWTRREVRQTQYRPYHPAYQQSSRVHSDQHSQSYRAPYYPSSPYQTDQPGPKAQKAQEMTTFCINCGSSIPYGDMFCSYCGAEQKG